ncbi:MAG: sodium:panthothenate symporter, partial [Lentisphaeria bacterium]|nr:sodium:panthothenate symporter [Lentisphaeria bacterium]
MAQLDYINLFCVITTSVWMGGAGPVMVGGLYTRFGTTAGAYASLCSSIVISGGGILVQRNWADFIYPFLERQNWVVPLGNFLERVSAPFAPYIVWRMDPVKFPVNSNELFFISMVTGIILYCAVSFITQKQPFDLDKMLHRDELPECGAKKSIFSRMLGIDEAYTRGDKIIAWSVFIYSFIYSFIGCFVIVIIWNCFAPWGKLEWGWYFFLVNLAV